MEQSERPGAPGIASVLYLIGGLSVAIGLLGLVALFEDKNASDAAIAGSGILGGCLLCGFGYGLHKLRQIEWRLRKPTAVESRG